MDERELETLDAEGYVVLEALAYDRPPPHPSHASPHAFVCVDGGTYWVKRTAQQGLVAELIAGRLGAIVGAAPDARIIRVTNAVTPSDGSADPLIGIGVGARDAAGMENLRVIQNALPGGVLDPDTLEVRSRLLVLTFQTWLGVGDTQILVDLRNGRLLSLDHGDWGADPADRGTPTLISTPGVSDDFGRGETGALNDALERISGVSDERILRACAGVPSGVEWNAARARRFALAEWIAFRRDRLPEVMRRWQSGP